MIRIENKRTYVHDSCDFVVPIHRGTPLGNLYDWKGSRLAKFVVKDRDEAIAKYQPWLLEKIEKRDREIMNILGRAYKVHASEQVPVILLCYCTPLPCHGEFIKHILEIDERVRE